MKPAHLALTGLAAAATVTVATPALANPPVHIIGHVAGHVAAHAAADSLRLIRTRPTANPPLLSGSPRTGRFLITGKGTAVNKPSGVATDVECALEQLRFNPRLGRLEWHRLPVSDMRTGQDSCHAAVAARSLLTDAGDSIRLRGRVRVHLRELDGVRTVARHPGPWGQSTAWTFTLGEDGGITRSAR